jgi:broad specificity phosphatase PhoE
MQRAGEDKAEGQWPADAPRKPGSIVLVRHGQPAADRRVKVDWRGYEQWWAAYDRAGLAAGETAPPALVAAAERSDIFFASPLARAVATAQAVAGERQVIQDSVFVEAALPPPPIWGKRTPNVWGVWARTAWWLGRHAGRESRREAELRAEAAAATLTARALRGENVILFGHGWFNRMIRPVLREQGWTCIYDGGDSYWSFRRYEKR